MSNHDRVLKILGTVLNRASDSIKPEHDLKNELEIDSAQTLELLSTLEEEFDLDIEETEAAKVHTVADLVALVSA